MPRPQENVADGNADAGEVSGLTDKVVRDALEQALAHPVNMQDRISQMVSFVWGNSLETDRTTIDSVCESLHIDTTYVRR
jgi:hypothetical protein